MQCRFELDEIRLYNAIKQVKKGCSVCQACNRDSPNVKREAQWTPIPEQPMASVAMDVFSMPEVHIGRNRFGWCGPVCAPTQWPQCGNPVAQKAVASQGRGSHDDSSLADRLRRPPHPLQ